MQEAVYDMTVKWLPCLYLYVSSNRDLIPFWAVCSTLDSSNR